MRKSTIQWKRDWTLDQFNEEVKKYIGGETAKKEVVEYFNSWLGFVEKQNRKASIVFDRVREERKEIMNR